MAECSPTTPETFHPIFRSDLAPSKGNGQFTIWHVSVFGVDLRRGDTSASFRDRERAITWAEAWSPDVVYAQDETSGEYAYLKGSAEIARDKNGVILATITTETVY